MVFYDKNFSNFSICKYYSEDCEQKASVILIFQNVKSKGFNLNQKRFIIC